MRPGMTFRSITYSKREHNLTNLDMISKDDAAINPVKRIDFTFPGWESLLEGATYRSYQRGVIVVSEGDDTANVFFIESGRVRVFLSNSDGDEVTIGELRAGDYFGEMALLPGAISASIMTEEHSRFACIRVAEFRKFLAAHPESLFSVLGKLIERNRQSNRRLKSIALHDVYGRLKQLLIDLAEEIDGVLTIRIALTQQEMASRIGGSREMVGKILRELSKGGYIEIARKEIKILRCLPRAW